MVIEFVEKSVSSDVHYVYGNKDKQPFKFICKHFPAVGKKISEIKIDVYTVDESIQYIDDDMNVYCETWFFNGKEILKKVGKK